MLQDHAEIVTALNVHGTFFERLCQERIEAAPGWQLAFTNLPVSFNGKEGEIDARAVRTFSPDMMYTIVVEAKKNNPKLSRWTFFKANGNSVISHFFAMLQLQRMASGDFRPTAHLSRIMVSTDVPLVVEAREVKGDYLQAKRDNNYTKTANHQIYEACRQAVLGIQASLDEEWYVADQSIRLPGQKVVPYTHVFIPIVVTTADLLLVDFDPKFVSPVDGTVDPSLVTFAPTKWVLYRFPVPRSLQRPLLPGQQHMSTYEIRDRPSRLPVFIVHAGAFEEFLANPGLYFHTAMVGDGFEFQRPEGFPEIYRSMATRDIKQSPR